MTDTLLIILTVVVVVAGLGLGYAIWRLTCDVAVMKQKFASKGAYAPFGGHARFPRSAPYAVYRFYGATGEPLYIGYTSDLARRTREHSKRAAWWREVRSMEFDLFATAEEARKQEILAIHAEQPQHNRLIIKPELEAQFSSTEPGPGVITEEVSIRLRQTMPDQVKQLLEEAPDRTLLPVEIYRCLGVSRTTFHRRATEWISEGWLTRDESGYRLVDGVSPDVRSVDPRRAPSKVMEMPRLTSVPRLTSRLDDAAAMATVWRLLGEAGPVGCTPRELYRAATRSSSWLHKWMTEAIADGRVVRTEQNLYALAHGQNEHTG